MTRFVTWDVDGKGGSSALYKYVHYVLITLFSYSPFAFLFFAMLMKNSPFLMQCSLLLPSLLSPSLSPLLSFTNTARPLRHYSLLCSIFASYFLLFSSLLSSHLSLHITSPLLCSPHIITSSYLISHYLTSSHLISPHLTSSPPISPRLT